MHTQKKKKKELIRKVNIDALHIISTSVTFGASQDPRVCSLGIRIGEMFFFC